MEILALAAILILFLVGFFVFTVVFRQPFTAKTLYLLPAIGMPICAAVAYLTVHAHMHRPLPLFLAIVCAGVVIRFFSSRFRASLPKIPSLFWFALGAIACVYLMQILLFRLTAELHPGPNEVWTLFNLTGSPPPDQMFAWHQAMFAEQHRVYPTDVFYDEMDLYDRPHLGGYITLFFFRLFHLPLKESHFNYPLPALRFYHAFWWLMNDLYLLGIAPLFRRLFSRREAVFAIAATAVSGIAFLTSTGCWIKFAAAYPFLLALWLFFERRSPALQALCCGTSFYLHGSMLPFILGLGLLHLLTLWPASRARRNFAKVFTFGGLTAGAIGAWFVVVRIAGSKQPLLYYYLYGAGLTQAQFESGREIARKFYATHPWKDVALFPLQSLAQGFFPWKLVTEFSWPHGWANQLGRIASTVFSFQRFCFFCALSVATAPLVIFGALRALGRRNVGKYAFCLYLVPTLFVALIYRQYWSFSIHIVLPYQMFALAMLAIPLVHARTRSLVLVLLAIALEGLLCSLFADERYLPISGIQHFVLTRAGGIFLAAYLFLLLSFLFAAGACLRGLPPSRPAPFFVVSSNRLTGYRLLTGLGVAAGAVALYALYSLRFY